jgi:hypothetical protein
VKVITHIITRSTLHPLAIIIITHMMTQVIAIAPNITLTDIRIGIIFVVLLRARTTTAHIVVQQP